MTATPETHFKCDRCSTETYTVLQNTPMQSRHAPPDGWSTVWVDSTDHQTHLCASCSDAFRTFMLPIA